MKKLIFEGPKNDKVEIDIFDKNQFRVVYTPSKYKKSDMVSALINIGKDSKNDGEKKQTGE